MQFQDVVICSVAAIEAPHRVSSLELEDRLRPLLKRLGISSGNGAPGAPGVIASLSGVIARRFWDEGTQPSEVAAQAGEQAILRSGLEKSRIGVLVNTSVCRDFIEPSTACLVHGRLGLSDDCLNFDLSNACLGFIHGMDLVARMIERREVEAALVVDGEGSRVVVERTIERLNASGDAKMFAESFATLTLGSGAAAMVLAHKDVFPEGHAYRGSVTLSATEHSHLCRGKDEWMVTDGNKLLAAGLELAKRTFERAKDELSWQAEALAEVVIHQVSRQHTDKLAAMLGIAPERIWAIFPEHGNIGPASVPMVLAAAEKEGRMQRGDRVALMGIGSGLNCAMAEVVW
jgi:acyl-CoA:acyl-CoA alkyltransferase